MVEKTVADRMFGKPQKRQSARELLRWLLLVPIAFLILFGCGQLGLGNVVNLAAPDTRSKLRADYSVWPLAVIPAIDPAIIDDLRRDEHLNSTVIARPFWPTSNRPTATRQPTLIAQQPTATPVPPTGTPTPIDTPTPTPQPTRTALPTAIPTTWPTSTETPWPTETSQPTATPKTPRAATRTHTPTPITPSVTASPTVALALTPSMTPSDTPTSTPTDTPMPTASFTPTATPTLTPTDTATPTETATPTQTATSTPTPTITPTPCSGYIPPGEPNIGPPNGIIAEIACGAYLNIDLDSVGAPHITSHPGYDFVYFEHAGCGGICLDWVRVDVSGDGSNWVTVFNWGDGNPDNNTNIASYTGGSELDNAPIPASALYCSNGYCTGIEIDVDALGPVPPGGYRYIRFWSPINWPNNDGSEVDSILIFP